MDELLRDFDRVVDRLMAELPRAMVALVWADQKSDGSEPSRLQAASGFIVRTKGYWFWVTAGHVLKQLCKDSEDAGYKVLSAGFMDGWHNGGNGEVIPVALPRHPTTWIFKEELGIDVGAMLLDQHTARLLQRGGCSPVPRSMWANKGERFDLLAMMGFPKDHRTRRIIRTGSTTTGTIGLGTPLIPLVPCEPTEVVDCPYPRYHGRLDRQTFSLDGTEYRVDDIDGMSGGPVYGLLRTETGFRIKLAGVQSGWHRSKRVTAACPIKDFMTVLARQTDAWLADRSETAHAS